MTITGATVIGQDPTPGRAIINFALRYDKVSEVLGNLHVGKQLEINGVFGTIEKMLIAPERDIVWIHLLAKEGIC